MKIINIRNRLNSNCFRKGKEIENWIKMRIPLKGLPRLFHFCGSVWKCYGRESESKMKKMVHIESWQYTELLGKQSESKIRWKWDGGSSFCGNHSRVGSGWWSWTPKIKSWPWIKSWSICKWKWKRQNLTNFKSSYFGNHWRVGNTGSNGKESESEKE